MDTFILPFAKVEKLYIKLDKKLIVHADKIVLNHLKSSDDSKIQLFKIIKRLKYIKPIFKEVEFHNIVFKNDTLRLFYRNDIFYFYSNYLQTSTLIEPFKDGFLADIQYLEFKDYKLGMKGKLRANVKDESGFFTGTFKTFGINGFVNLTYENDKLNFNLSTKSFQTVENLASFLHEKSILIPVVYQWIAKRAVAKEYKVDYLQGEYHYKKNKVDINKIESRIYAKDVSVIFKENVKPVKIKELNIILKNNELIFYPQKSTFMNRKIYDEKIKIYKLFTKYKNGITIHFKAKTPLDNKIHSILKEFKIKLPLYQASGQTSAVMDINIPFDFSIKNDIKGEFIAKKSAFIYKSDTKFSTDYVKVQLNNRDLRILNTNIKYDNFLNFNTTGTIDIANNSYMGTAIINRFLINAKDEKVIDVKNLYSNLFVEQNNKGTLIDIIDADVKMNLLKNKNRIEIINLSKIYPHSPLLKKYEFKEGSVNIKTKDFEKYTLLTKLHNIKLPVSRDKKAIKSLDLTINTNKKSTHISTNDKSIQLFISDKNEIKLEKYDININQFTNKKTDAQKIKAEISGKDCNLLIDKDKKLATDIFNAKIDKDFIIFNAKYQDSVIEYREKDHKIDLFMDNLNSNYLKDSTGIEGLYRGTYKLTATGYDDNISGKLHIKNSVLKDFKLFNNLMAFINTVPSLIFLQNPKFSENGYEVKKGLFDFRKSGDIITFKKIELEGYSSDIFGSGTYNTKTKEINLKLEISTFKTVKNLLNIIPIVNYIILGKDGTISTNLKITNQSYDPKISFEILKDTIKMPMNIIKRTLELPFKIFKRDENDTK